MTKHLTHAEVFVECPWPSDQMTNPMELQFVYVFSHNYLMGIDSNITELLEKWRKGYGRDQRRKFVQRIELSDRMRIDQGPNMLSADSQGPSSVISENRSDSENELQISKSNESTKFKSNEHNDGELQISKSNE